MKLSSKKMRRQREENVIKNGARMLEELISSCDGRVNPIRMYSAAELEKAIGNTKPVFSTGIACYYKGTYLGRTILIEKYDSSDDCLTRWNPDPIFNELGVDLIFNELGVLSQMKHMNVVKLLGCCLETEIPILVYKFPSNGRLSDHINDLSWEYRLRIASQVAHALTYMHTGTSQPIVHRNIKPHAILLDENYSPKVIELGLSVTIPLGETHVQTEAVVGTFAYLDPQHIVTSQVTEKCDVYGFGQLLLDLLTQTLSSERRKETMDETVDFAISSIKDELDACNCIQGKMEQLLAFGVLASRCVRLYGEQRPTMKEVAQELMRIIRSSSLTRNTTETENVSVHEVLQELRRMLRSCYEPMYPRENLPETESLSNEIDFSVTESLSDLSDFSPR